MPTPTEAFLSQVCQRSFLSLWSHPHPHRKINPVPHELCDVLVVFGNDVLFFSDKSISFPTHNDLRVAWGRWYRKAVVESANQLFAASRWVRNHPDKIFADAKCLQPLRVPLPDPSVGRYHLIAVAWGAGDACQRFYGPGNSPSLMVMSNLTGDAHLDEPFHLGRVDGRRQFVHVFDEVGLQLVMNEINTAADFVRYLEKRAVLLTDSNCMILATGEEELLAAYLTNLNEKNEHSFLAPGEGKGVDGVFFDAGFWQGYVDNPKRLAKLQADKISYIWDTLLEHLIRTLPEFSQGGPTEFQKLMRETALRTMAAEPRLSRRMIGRNLAEAMELTRNLEPNKIFVRIGYVHEKSDTAYVFLLMGPDPALSHATYQERRSIMLQTYCKILCCELPEVKQVVGIGMVPFGLTPTSEALLFLKRENLTADDLADARGLQRELGFLVGFRERAIRDHVKEYPDTNDADTGSENNKRD